MLIASQVRLLTISLALFALQLTNSCTIILTGALLSLPTQVFNFTPSPIGTNPTQPGDRSLRAAASAASRGGSLPSNLGMGSVWTGLDSESSHQSGGFEQTSARAELEASRLELTARLEAATARETSLQAVVGRQEDALR